MLISGFGYSMNTDATRPYAPFNPVMAKPASPVDDSGISLNTQRAAAEMNQDPDLKEFSVFIPSGEIPQPVRYQEDWMRPTENFAL